MTTEYTHRVAMATFWRTFHHDGKNKPSLVRVGGARPPPTITYKVVMYAPAERAYTIHLFLIYPYVVMTTVVDYENSDGKILINLKLKL
jgi:hypothetical protein